MGASDELARKLAERRARCEAKANRSAMPSEAPQTSLSQSPPSLPANQKTQEEQLQKSSPKNIASDAQSTSNNTTNMTGKWKRPFFLTSPAIAANPPPHMESKVSSFGEPQRLNTFNNQQQVENNEIEAIEEIEEIEGGKAGKEEDETELASSKPSWKNSNQKSQWQPRKEQSRAFSHQQEEGVYQEEQEGEHEKEYEQESGKSASTMPSLRSGNKNNQWQPRKEQSHAFSHQQREDVYQEGQGGGQDGVQEGENEKLASTMPSWRSANINNRWQPRKEHPGILNQQKQEEANEEKQEEEQEIESTTPPRRGNNRDIQWQPEKEHHGVFKPQQEEEVYQEEQEIESTKLVLPKPSWRGVNRNSQWQPKKEQCDTFIHQKEEEVHEEKEEKEIKSTRLVSTTPSRRGNNRNSVWQSKKEQPDIFNKTKEEGVYQEEEQEEEQVNTKSVSPKLSWREALMKKRRQQKKERSNESIQQNDEETHQKEQEEGQESMEPVSPRPPWTSNSNRNQEKPQKKLENNDEEVEKDGRNDESLESESNEENRLQPKKKSLESFNKCKEVAEKKEVDIDVAVEVEVEEGKERSNSVFPEPSWAPANQRARLQPQENRIGKFNQKQKLIDKEVTEEEKKERNINRVSPKRSLTDSNKNSLWQPKKESFDPLDWEQDIAKDEVEQEEEEYEDKSIVSWTSSIGKNRWPSENVDQFFTHQDTGDDISTPVSPRKERNRLQSHKEKFGLFNRHQTVFDDEDDIAETVSSGASSATAAPKNRLLPRTGEAVEEEEIQQEEIQEEKDRDERSKPFSPKSFSISTNQTRQSQPKGQSFDPFNIYEEDVNEEQVKEEHVHEEEVDKAVHEVAIKEEESPKLVLPKPSRTAADNRDQQSSHPRSLCTNSKPQFNGILHSLRKKRQPQLSKKVSPIPLKDSDEQKDEKEENLPPRQTSSSAPISRNISYDDESHQVEIRGTNDTNGHIAKNEKEDEETSNHSTTLKCRKNKSKAIRASHKNATEVPTKSEAVLTKSSGCSTDNSGTSEPAMPSTASVGIIEPETSFTESNPTDLNYERSSATDQSEIKNSPITAEWKDYLQSQKSKKDFASSAAFVSPEVGTETPGKIPSLMDQWNNDMQDLIQKSKQDFTFGTNTTPPSAMKYDVNTITPDPSSSSPPRSTKSSSSERPPSSELSSGPDQSFLRSSIMKQHARRSKMAKALDTSIEVMPFSSPFRPSEDTSQPKKDIDKQNIQTSKTYDNPTVLPLSISGRNQDTHDDASVDSITCEMRVVIENSAHSEKDAIEAERDSTDEDDEVIYDMSEKPRPGVKIAVKNSFSFDSSIGDGTAPVSMCSKPYELSPKSQAQQLSSQNHHDENKNKYAKRAEHDNNLTELFEKDTIFDMDESYVKKHNNHHGDNDSVACSSITGASFFVAEDTKEDEKYNSTSLSIVHLEFMKMRGQIETIERTDAAALHKLQMENRILKAQELKNDVLIKEKDSKLNALVLLVKELGLELNSLTGGKTMNITKRLEKINGIVPSALSTVGSNERGSRHRGENMRVAQRETEQSQARKNERRVFYC